VSYDAGVAVLVPFVFLDIAVVFVDELFVRGGSSAKI